MEEKNFLGLEGLKYFWTKIEAKVIKIIEDEIAQIIAEAPEDLDTLKEIADWISTHEDSASAMNTAILANKTAISGKADKSHTHTKSQITDFDHTHDDRYYTESEIDTKLSRKSDTGHTHTKSQITDFPTSLPANGGIATKATQDGNGNVIASTYVKKSGDTLTGPIVMKANQYTLETAQLDMKNSDIKGANAIWFDDHAEVGEGLKFPRSSGSNYDFMRLDDGKIKVAPNVTENANTATESIVAYTSDIPTSLPANGGTADRVTTGINYSGEQSDCISAKQTSESFNNSKEGWASYIICNHGNGKNYYHQMLRFDFFNDSIQFQRRTGGNLQGWKNVAILENTNTWTNNQYFDETITPRQGTIDGATVSIGRIDGCITIGDTDNDNNGFTVINNDCKMLYNLEVSGNCTIKNTSDNKYKSVVSGEITGTTLTLYLN